MSPELEQAFLTIANRLFRLASEDADVREAILKLANVVRERGDAAAPEEPPIAPEDAARAFAGAAAASWEEPAAPPAARESVEELAARLTLGRAPVQGPAPPREPARPASAVDLALVKKRCQIKAEGARWAQRRAEELSAGADLQTQILPMDRAIIEKARALPDCFLWMHHSSAPVPLELADWGVLAGCFEAAAEAVGLVREIGDDTQTYAAEFEKALELLAEAQSALRVQVMKIGGEEDRDQKNLYQWLRDTTRENQVYLDRYMRINDPADPKRWEDLRERIGQVEATINEKKRTELRQRKLFGRIKYKAQRIARDPASDEEWAGLVQAVEEYLETGIRPSNPELRDVLLPIVDDLPDLGEVPAGFERALREIDRYLGSVRPEASLARPPSPSPHIDQAARLLRGRSIVLIGGESREHARQAIQEALELAEVDWITTRAHQSIASFEARVARPEVAAVVLAIRWSSHSFGDVKQFCDQFDKPLVRLPGGYNPTQVAKAILEQCGRRLENGRPE